MEMIHRFVRWAWFHSPTLRKYIISARDHSTAMETMSEIVAEHWEAMLDARERLRQEQQRNADLEEDLLALEQENVRLRGYA